MNPMNRFVPGLAGLLLAGVAVAAGPVNPPPPTCGFDEVRECRVIGGVVYCRCVKRDVAIPPGPGIEPRGLRLE